MLTFENVVPSWSPDHASPGCGLQRRSGAPTVELNPSMASAYELRHGTFLWCDVYGAGGARRRAATIGIKINSPRLAQRGGSSFSEEQTMAIVARAITITVGIVGLIGSAQAADMTDAEIKAFLAGKTVYLETTAASASGKAGQGVIYWAEDGTALYKTPTGAIMHGKWQIKGNTNCTDWKERPNTPCVRYDKTGDAVTVIDVANGQVRAKVVKTAPGNAEKLAP
jgi:hypothetical protein